MHWPQLAEKIHVTADMTDVHNFSFFLDSTIQILLILNNNFRSIFKNNKLKKFCYEEHKIVLHFLEMQPLDSEFYLKGQMLKSQLSNYKCDYIFEVINHS